MIVFEQSDENTEKGTMDDGRHGLYALIFGELLTVPYLLLRKKECKTKAYPLVPFLFAGFLGIFVVP